LKEVKTMGKKSNVNPDHYKTAGREPQGQAVLQELERQKFTEKKARLSRATARPAAAPTRKKAPATREAPKRLAGPAKALATEPVTKNMDQNLQGSGKKGKRSMARKREGSRHGLNSTPATRPVPGAYGKRKAASEILAVREEYDSKKRSQPVKKNTAPKRT
jgi:hypothetical protein